MIKLMDLLDEAKGHTGGAAKKFEDDIITLAILSTKNKKEKNLTAIYDNNSNSFTSGKKNKIILSVEKLNSKWGRKWTEGKNSNTAAKGSPTYGKKSAKSDIVLNNNKFPISVKLDTDFVIASAQDKKEFSGIFISAFDYYQKDKGKISTNMDNVIKELENKIKLAATNYIGEIEKRHVKSQDFLNKWKVKPGDVKKAKAFYDKLVTEIKNDQKKHEDKYKVIIDKIQKGIQKDINDSLNNNLELKHYVTWEALSSSLKYNFQIPYAPWVLSPKGLYDISSPSQSYVKACASVSSLRIGGLPQGRMRSGKTAALRPYIKQIVGGEKVDITNVLNDINGMVLGMKIDVRIKKLEAELKKLSNITELYYGKDGNLLLEFEFKQMIKGFYEKIKNVFNSIKEYVMSVVKKIINKLNALKGANIYDIMIAIDAKPIGSIKIK